METKRLFFALALSFVALHVIGQQTILEGQVTNRSGQSVSAAFVHCNSNVFQTDSSGKFRIQTDHFPCLIQIRHFAYVPFEQVIQNPQRDTLVLRFILTEKATELDEFIVESGSSSLAYTRKSTHIIDYHLGESDMLILCKERNTYYLRYSDETSTTISEHIIRKHPERFFRDCMNNLYVLYPDSSYLIASDGEAFYLTDPVATDIIYEKLAPCALNSGHRFFFSDYSNYGQTLHYTLNDTLVHESRTFYVASDQKYALGLQEYTEQQRATANMGNTMGENSADFQRTLRRAGFNLYFAEATLSLPLYIPLFELRDSVFLFDHLNNIAVVYDELSTPVRTNPVNYHQRATWDRSLYTDVAAERVFAAFNDRGIVSLAELDPVNGHILSETQIENHLYPENIQIRGNYIYYIRHVFGETSIDHLYKQRIVKP